MSNPPNDEDRLYMAVELYRERFGIGPPVFEFMGWPAALARELAAAVVRGEALTADDLYERIGVAPPPDNAIL